MKTAKTRKTLRGFLRARRQRDVKRFAGSFRSELGMSSSGQELVNSPRLVQSVECFLDTGPMQTNEQGALVAAPMMIIKYRHNLDANAIKFKYAFAVDTPQEVAKEMILDFNLEGDRVESILCDAIRKAIDEAFKTHPAAAQAAQQAQQQAQQPHSIVSQQPQQPLMAQPQLTQPAPQQPSPAPGPPWRARSARHAAAGHIPDAQLAGMRATAKKKAEEEAKKVLEKMQQEVGRRGGLKYLSARFMKVGKFNAGKTTLFRAIKEEPYKQDCGSTVGADLADIEISQLEFSEDSAADTQKQQRTIAKNVAAEYHQKLKWRQGQLIARNLPIFNAQQELLVQQGQSRTGCKLLGRALAASTLQLCLLLRLLGLFLKRGADPVIGIENGKIQGADPKLKQACLSHLRFWLRSLEMHAYDKVTGWAPIFLVGTHKDEVSKELEHRRIADILDHEFQGSKIYHCKKLYRPQNGRPFAFFPVDSMVRPVDPAIKALMRAVEAAAREEEYVKREIPVPCVNLFDKLFAKAKELSWLSYEEVLKLAQSCEVVNTSESIDLILAYLHDQGRVMHFADHPSLRTIVILDPTNLTRTKYRYIAKAAHTLPLPRSRLRRGMLDKCLLPLLWEDISAETREHLLALMVRFGLAVELQPDASTAKDQTEFLVPALLPDSPPASIPESKMLPVKCSLAFYPRDEQVHSETNVERLKALGFLSSGFFSRLVGKCFSWSQGWSAGVNWKYGWSFASAPATYFKPQRPEGKLRMHFEQFGALRFEITVSEDLNLLRLSCGHENPRALLRRLLLLCKERNCALVRLEKAQEAVRKRMLLRVGHDLLQPDQVVQEFSPGWFPSAQPPSKFDAFWSFREGLFDAALVGKLQERLLDMGVPPFMMAWAQQQGNRLEQVPSASVAASARANDCVYALVIIPERCWK
eukprot:g30830.t1